MNTTLKDLENYFWREYFYNHILQKLGQDYINNLKDEYEIDREARYQVKRQMMLDNGWEEDGRGIYISKKYEPSEMTEEQKSKQLEITKRIKKDLEEFKRRRLGQRNTTND